jgi:hypothetical protein
MSLTRDQRNVVRVNLLRAHHAVNLFHLPGMPL